MPPTSDYIEHVLRALANSPYIDEATPAENYFHALYRAGLHDEESADGHAFFNTMPWEQNALALRHPFVLFNPTTNKIVSNYGVQSL